MSKSNATEIISILWIIAALLAKGWFSYVCAFAALVSIIESIVYAARKL